MTDKFSTQEEDIIRYLKDLDRSAIEYPADSLEKRRDNFQKAINELSLAVPGAGLPKGRFNFPGRLQ